MTGAYPAPKPGLIEQLSKGNVEADCSRQLTTVPGCLHHHNRFIT